MRSLQAEATVGVESVGLGRVTSGDGRLRDASFALAKSDVAHFERHLDLAVLRAIGASAVAAPGDDAQRAGERLFGQGAEVALQAEGRAGLAEPDLDVARRQDPILVLQGGLIEADGRRKFADDEFEARGEVAFLDPRLAGPAHAGVGERERSAFGPHEEAFSAEASDEVGAREVAG